MKEPRWDTKNWEKDMGRLLSADFNQLNKKFKAKKKRKIKKKDGHHE